MIPDAPTPDGSETIVTEGGNIDVAGSGTTGSPYVVTNLAPEISEIDSIDQYTFILDKGSNPADTVRFEFDSLFAPNFDIGLFDTFDINNIVFFAAILRPALNQTTGVITWELINDPDHIPVFDGAITTPTTTSVRIAYKEPIEKILFFHVTPDDALAKTGVSAGASVGLSYATIHMSVPWTTRQIVTYNGSAWTNTGHVFTTVTQSGTTILSTISSGGFYNSEYTYGNVQAIYAGTNNRVLRQIFSGIGYWQTKWELIDPTTGSAATPDTNDKIVLFNPNLAYTLPSQTADGMGVARRVFDPTILPNFWISGAFLKN
ncbi:hypothetical protein EKI60_06385 [Candidatus Saccharibacteria bacterium]|nr:MAG: hypothetical protein EKI60_06385 [Candidatus Saccharibacteria bacterium]